MFLLYLFLLIISTILSSFFNCIIIVSKSISPWSSLYNSFKHASYDSGPQLPINNKCFLFFLYFIKEYFDVKEKIFSISNLIISIYGIRKAIPVLIKNLPKVLCGVISPKPIVVIDTNIKYITSWKFNRLVRVIVLNSLGS